MSLTPRYTAGAVLTGSSGGNLVLSTSVTASVAAILAPFYKGDTGATGPVQTGAEIKAAYEAEANAFTDAQFTKLAGIEALADVTDTTNVTDAGALMDSELADIIAVKALDQGVATTDSPSFGTLTGTTAVNAGISDNTNGIFRAYGKGAGSTGGGEFRAYLSADYDANNYYVMRGVRDDLIIEMADGTDLLKYDFGLSEWQFTGNIAVTGTVDGRDVAADGTLLDEVGHTSKATFAAGLTWANAASPSAGDKLSVAVGGAAGSITYVYDGVSTYLPDAELSGWAPVAPVWLEHYGIVTATTAALATTDYATELQAALTNTTGTLHCGGYVYSASALTWPKTCGFKIVGDIESGGICTDTSLGTVNNLIDFGTTLGPSIESLHVWYRQPAGITLRSQLDDHAALLNFDDASRGFIGHLRISQATRGIDAVDTGSGSNPGGWKIGVAEIGAFNVPFRIDGALDFIKIDDIHIWQFGISGTAALATIWSDGAATGSQIISVDGLDVDTFATFQIPVELGEAASATIMPFMLGLQLDGDAAHLTFKGGRSVIKSLYSTKTASATATTITVEDGVHHLNTPHMIGGEALCIDVESGGELNVHGGLIQNSTASKRGAKVQSGGILRLLGVVFDFPDAAGTVPFVEQEAGGVLVVDGCTGPTDHATARSEVVKYNSDVAGNYLNPAPLAPHTCVFTSTWETGTYGFIAAYDFGSDVLPYLKDGKSQTLTTDWDSAPVGVPLSSGQLTETAAVAINLPAMGGGGSDNRWWLGTSNYQTGGRTVQNVTEMFGIGSSTKGRTFQRIKHDTWFPWAEISTSASTTPIHRIATLEPSAVATTEQTWATGYSRIRLDLTEVKPATDGATLWLRLRKSGAYQTAGYAWAVNGVSSGAASIADSAGAGSGVLNNTAIPIGNVTGAERGVSGWVEIIAPDETAYTHYFGQIRYYDTAGLPKSFSVNGVLRTANLVDGVQLLFSTGNITSGKIVITGYVE
jgi:hypothetical protein